MLIARPFPLTEWEIGKCRSTCVFIVCLWQHRQQPDKTLHYLKYSQPWWQSPGKLNKHFSAQSQETGPALQIHELYQNTQGMVLLLPGMCQKISETGFQCINAFTSPCLPKLAPWGKHVESGRKVEDPHLVNKDAPSADIRNLVRIWILMLRASQRCQLSNRHKWTRPVHYIEHWPQNAFYNHLLLAAELVWLYLGKDKANP